MSKKPKVGIVGLGMVGKPLLKYFSESGWKRGENLFCFDSTKEEFKDSLKTAKIIFVCVPTPVHKDGSCDTSIVEEVIKTHNPPTGGKNKVFVIKSTVEPGTAQKLQKKYKTPVLFNPEFLTEVNAWNDFMNPDRQIVAHSLSSKYARNLIKILPKSQFKNICDINSTEAELGKYASNVFGALKVVYSNIVADFATALGVDYENVRKVFASDRRIGDYWTYVKHGNYRGYGGYCFPKDTEALIALGERLGVKKGIKVLKAMRDYNEKLLESQGLNSKIVSLHDSDLKRFLKNSVKKI